MLGFRACSMSRRVTMQDGTLKRVIRSPRTLLLGIAVVAASSYAPCASAQRTDNEATQLQALLGTTFAILSHELGHAVIGELQVPATGPEEDVADGFSAITMSDMTEEQMDDPDLRGLLRYASLLWYHMASRPDASASWQDEHAPDIRRFYNSFCLIYGRAPAHFQKLADEVKFETRTRQRCIREYHRRKRAWVTILEPVSLAAQVAPAGADGTIDPGGKVVVTVSPASTPFGRIVESFFAEAGFAHEFSRVLGEKFAWPRDLKIEFRDCDSTNAWYDPGAGKVTVCYSIIEMATNLVLRADGIVPTLTTRTMPIRRYAKGAAYIRGTWVAHLPTDQGLVTVTASYAVDHTFKLEAGDVLVVGRWDVEHAGGDMLTLHVDPTDRVPRERFDADGSRESVVQDQERQRSLVRMLGPDTVDSDGVIWRRRTENAGDPPREQ